MGNEIIKIVVLNYVKIVSKIINKWEYVVSN